jgi:hypothetical protein
MSTGLKIQMVYSFSSWSLDFGKIMSSHY